MIGRLDAGAPDSGKFLQWDRLLSFTSLHRRRATVFTDKKMLQRCQQIRTQPSFLLANIVEIPALQQQRKEPLCKIFRLLGTSALTPDETIDRSPISAAKFFQCLPGFRGLTVRFQHHAPMRRGKRDTAALRAWGDSIPRRLILVSGHVYDPNKKARDKQARILACAWSCRHRTTDWKLLRRIRRNQARRPRADATYTMPSRRTTCLPASKSCTRA